MRMCNCSLGLQAQLPLQGVVRINSICLINPVLTACIIPNVYQCVSYQNNPVPHHRVDSHFFCSSGLLDSEFRSPKWPPEACFMFYLTLAIEVGVVGSFILSFQWRNILYHQLPSLCQSNKSNQFPYSREHTQYLAAALEHILGADGCQTAK